MNEAALSLALIGLGTGAVYAGLGMGLVTVFRGSGVINFSQSLFGLWAAFAFTRLRSEGTLVLPVVWLPGDISLGGPVPVGFALTLALAETALIAAAAYLLVFRPLGHHSDLARVVASVGLLTVLQSLVIIRFGTDSAIPAQVLPTNQVSIGSVAVGADRLVLAGVVVAIAALLTFALRLTRLGIAIRAASEDEELPAYAGWAPMRVGLLTWVGGALVTALVAILAAPVTGLSAANYAVLIVPALAAALVGSMTSLIWTACAGLALGMLQAELQYLGTMNWWPDWGVTGAGDALPFLIVVIVLAARGTSLPTRSGNLTTRLPAVRREPVSRPAVAAACAFGLGAVLVTNGTTRYAVITTLIMAIACLSLVVIAGYLGQMSLAQLGIAGVAAYMLSRLDFAPFPLNALLAIATGTLAGVCAALPALRIRGVQLAVVTFAAAYAAEQFIFANPSFVSLDGNLVSGPSFLGMNLSVRSGADIATWRFGTLCFAAFVLCALAIHRLISGATGRRFLAIRSNELAAAAVGINVTRAKIVGFALSASLASLSGVLLAYSRGQVSAASFSALAGVTVLTYAFLGGITSVSGSIWGGMIVSLGVVYTLFGHLFHVGDTYILLSGVGVIAMAIRNPEGLAGAVGEQKRTVLKRLRLVSPPRPRSRGLVWRPTPVPAPPGSCLEVRGLTVSYGGTVAVSDVSLRVDPGRIVGLIGPNGAGKSSLVDAITGVTSYSGQVFLGEKCVDRLHADQRFRAGLARTWQGGELFPDLTARENLLVALPISTGAALARDLSGYAMESEAVDFALAFLGLDSLADRRPEELTVGQQKLVGLARCVVSNAPVLLLDEAFAGLTSLESEEIAQRVRALADRGKAVLLIDHDLNVIRSVCDEAYVMDIGAVIANGAPEEVLLIPAVRTAYLGEQPERLQAGPR